MAAPFSQPSGNYRTPTQDVTTLGSPPNLKTSVTPPPVPPRPPEYSRSTPSNSRPSSPYPTSDKPWGDYQFTKQDQATINNVKQHTPSASIPAANSKPVMPASTDASTPQTAKKQSPLRTFFSKFSNNSSSKASPSIAQTNYSSPVTNHSSSQFTKDYYNGKYDVESSAHPFPEVEHNTRFDHD